MPKASETKTRPRLPEDSEQVVDRVRERYGRIADGKESGCYAPPCCEPEASTAEADQAGRVGYEADDLESVPEGANLGLGCGAPVPLLRLEEGESVLDLGSGAGLDAFLAAREVGSSGRVIGVDMTPEMIGRARENATKAGLSQVEFRQGRLEALPVGDASFDAVTSNCVINLVPDKATVFREVARVLKPGGRLVISDIVLDGELPEPVTRDLLAWVGCVAGALQRESYFKAVRAAGLSEIDVISDVDFLEKMGDSLPQDLQEVMKQAGIEATALEGKIRSVTFRAVKR